MSLEREREIMNSKHTKHVSQNTQTMSLKTFSQTIVGVIALVCLMFDVSLPDIYLLSYLLEIVLYDVAYVKSPLVITLSKTLAFVLRDHVSNSVVNFT